MNDEVNQDDPWAAALAEQAASDNAGSAGADSDPWAEAMAEQASATVGPDIQPSVGHGADIDTDVLLDIPVTLSMELGRTKISIRQLLQLNQGSVVELDRLAGEPLDILVNNTLVAHGEVVVVNEKFGVRLTDVITPEERVRKLK